MLEAMNPVARRVAEGKRRAARAEVLTSLSTLDCIVFEKKIDQPNSSQERNEMYGDVEILGSGDEQAFSYEEKGFAKLKMVKFVGGTIYKDWSNIDGFESSFYGQIEPIIPDLKRREQLLQVPEWQLKNNDILAVVITAELIVYFEIVSLEGQSFADDYATKYRLNKRDDFNYIEPFKSKEYEVNAE